MKSISGQTRALIELLNEPVGLWERLRGGRRDAELLSQIADAGEPAAVVDLTPFVLAERRQTARAAAAAVGGLLASVTPAELSRLDLTFRERSPYAGRYCLAWHELAPAHLNNLESFGEHSLALLGAASFHESGYVREEAVKRLGRTSSGAELPFLLIRANDWVRNVREAAQSAVYSRLHPGYAGGFVANLPLVARLEHTERSDHRQMVEAIENLLRSSPCRDALFGGFKSTDRLIRRRSFKLATDAAGADLPSLLGLALGDPDTVIRLWAARRAAAGLDGRTLDEFLSRMWDDRFMPVRREALRTFVGRLPGRAGEVLRRALLDPHVSMREESRYHLRKTDGLNVASFYRQALESADERALYSAVSGLGEAGSASDDRVLIPYALHPSARVRGAAIRALSRLNGDAHLSVFTSALQDEAPAVSRESRKALAGRAGVVGGESLWEIFSASPLRHVRRNVLHLFSRLGKWDSVYFLVRAACDSDAVVAQWSRLATERWLGQFNRRFTGPTREQLARLGDALGECGALLDENTRQRLWFSMKGY